MNLDRLVQDFENDTTPLLRTDFSDDVAWERVIAEVTKEVDFGDGDDGLYAPNVQPYSDRAFEGATGQALADAMKDGDTLGYALLADDQAMREAVAGAELTVVYVDLSVDPEDAAEFGDVLGRTFRCEVGEFASIEANLSISNMDFTDFADNVEEDGVFRGFPE